MSDGDPHAQAVPLEGKCSTSLFVVVTLVVELEVYQLIDEPKWLQHRIMMLGLDRPARQLAVTVLHLYRFSCSWQVH